MAGDTAGVDLVAVGAHPDDVELGCGATLIQAVAAGHSVAVIDLTIGELGTRGSPGEREEERRRAAQIMGLQARPCIGLPDTEVGAEAWHVRALAAELRRLRPRIVLAPYPEDRHPDHAAAGRLAREACFLTGLAKAGEGDAHRVRFLFHYMIHYPFPPSFVVDVSATWDRKMEAVMAHTSQFGGERDSDVGRRNSDLLDVVDARARVHGAMIGTLRGEAFFSSGPVAVATVPGLSPAASGGGYRTFV